MLTGNDSGITDLVLLTLKFAWELFSKTVNKPEGLELIEKHIGRVMEKWKVNQDRLAILEPLINLLQALDLAIKASETLKYRKMLSKSIKMVLEIFEVLGAVEIKVRENDVFNPHFHHAIDVEQSFKDPKGRILEICRRGFMIKGAVFCPVEVVVSSGEEEKKCDRLPGGIEKGPDEVRSACGHKNVSEKHSFTETVGSMFDLSFFFPSDFNVDKIIYGMEETVVIEISSCQISSVCPICHKNSARRHSTYSRRPMDLPILGQTIRLKITCRKFFCDNPDCERSVFVERFKNFINSYARQTNRLKEILIALGFSSNAETNGKLSKKLATMVSPDTFLRIIRRTPIPVNHDVHFVGIDDWAFRKRHKYGTLICDLQTHRPIDLLDGRDSDTLESWLEWHPDIRLISRDRSNAYAKAIKNKCPNIVTVADRFHLGKNLLDALKDFTKRIFSPRIHIGYETPEILETKEVEKHKKELPSKKEKRRKEVREQKRKIVREVKKMHGEGLSIRAIGRNLLLSYRTVRRYIRLEEENAITYQRPPVPSILDPYENFIRNCLCQGEKAAAIFRSLKKSGYPGSETLVRQFVQRLKIEEGYNNKKSERKQEKANLTPPPKKKWIKRCEVIGSLWAYEGSLTLKESSTLEVIFEKFPVTKKLYRLIQNFKLMIKKRRHEELETWIEEALSCGASEIISFAKGLQKDFPEVHNALIYKYSNGLLEGHVNRLKMLKRLMYGRANLDLLKQRVLYRM